MRKVQATTYKEPASTPTAPSTHGPIATCARGGAGHIKHQGVSKARAGVRRDASREEEEEKQEGEGARAAAGAGKPGYIIGGQWCRLNHSAKTLT